MVSSTNNYAPSVTEPRFDPLIRYGPTIIHVPHKSFGSTGQTLCITPEEIEKVRRTRDLQKILPPVRPPPPPPQPSTSRVSGRPPLLANKPLPVPGPVVNTSTVESIQNISRSAFASNRVVADLLIGISLLASKPVRDNSIQIIDANN